MSDWPETSAVAWLTCALFGLPLLGAYLYIRASRARDADLSAPPAVSSGDAQDDEREAA